MTVEPSVLLEREISEDTQFTTIKDSFITWNDDDKGTLWSAALPSPLDVLIAEKMKEILDEVDLIICIGGDGTLLYTSSLFQVSGVCS